jgi:parallel beta-helix repeat protein
MKSIAAGITSMLLIIGMLALAFNIKPVKATGTIYIRADGSIDPPTAPVTTTDDFSYTLNGNVSQVIVEKDNIVIDGAFYAIGGLSMEDALILSGRSNVTVENTQIWTIGEFVRGTYVAMPGIYISDSIGIRLIGNSFTYNVFAVNIAYSNGTIISGNNIFIDKTATPIDTSQWEGISMEFSSGNIISDNNVTNCGVGVYLFSSSGNSVYHNNFVNNTQQVDSFNSTNTWDDGYPSGGNYWSDYNGTDLFSGPYQNETGSDGIGDKPYAMDTNNTDNYPLMKPYPWGPHDVGVTYIARVYEFGPQAYIFPLKTVGFVNIQLHLDVFVMNYGDYPEVLNLTVYANSTVVGQVSNVTLAAKNSTILDVPWDTSGFAKGNYTISAYIEPVLGETEVEDNNYTDGKIKITIPGDVNGDGTVDMRDIAYVARRFGMSPADPRWDPDADINDDGKIDMRDIGYVARCYGQHYP